MLYSLRLLLFIFATMFLITGCSSTKETVSTPEQLESDEEYPFDFLKSNSLSKVLDRAAEENKLVFVDIYTSWCLPCKMMDEDVFSHEGTAEIINADFVSYKVNAEKANGPDIATMFQVRSYPTLLFLDAKGNILERKEGVAYHSELLRLAASAKSKYAAISDAGL